MLHITLQIITAVSKKKNRKKELLPENPEINFYHVLCILCYRPVICEQQSTNGNSSMYHKVTQKYYIVQRHPSSSHRRHNHFSKKKKKLWVTKRFFFYNIGKNSVKYERMIYVYDRHIRYAS